MHLINTTFALWVCFKYFSSLSNLLSSCRLSKSLLSLHGGRAREYIARNYLEMRERFPLKSMGWWDFVMSRLVIYCYFCDRLCCSLGYSEQQMSSAAPRVPHKCINFMSKTFANLTDLLPNKCDSLTHAAMTSVATFWYCTYSDETHPHIIAFPMLSPVRLDQLLHAPVFIAAAPIAAPFFRQKNTVLRI